MKPVQAPATKVSPTVQKSSSTALGQAQTIQKDTNELGAKKAGDIGFDGAARPAGPIKGNETTTTPEAAAKAYRESGPQNPASPRKSTLVVPAPERNEDPAVKAGREKNQREYEARQNAAKAKAAAAAAEKEKTEKKKPFFPKRPKSEPKLEPVPVAAVRG